MRASTSVREQIAGRNYHIVYSSYSPDIETQTYNVIISNHTHFTAAKPTVIFALSLDLN